MHALTLRQPWGWAVACGGKRVENRSWPAPLWLTELAIHAGARSGWDEDGEESPLVRRAWADYARARSDAHNSVWFLRKESLFIDFSAIIAVASVVGCHRDGKCHMFPDFDDDSGRCSPWACAGQFHWRLGSVRTLAKPVECRGRQGLWIVPDDVERAIRAQLGEK